MLESCRFPALHPSSAYPCKLIRSASISATPSDKKWDVHVHPSPPGGATPQVTHEGRLDELAGTRSLFRVWWWQTFSVTADKDRARSAECRPPSVSLLIDRTPPRCSRTLSIFIIYSCETADEPTTITPRWNCQMYRPVACWKRRTKHAGTSLQTSYFTQQ